MATSSVILDIRANTQKALSEFKTFSAQLDNKFLVSGLKLDVVRNALSQINREFQKSLGEQGLNSAQSLKAAENQVAVLTNLFSGFSKTASGQIAEDFSKALSQVAIRTGATVNDIQKTLRTAPFLSRSLSQGDRQGILEQIQSLQVSTKRAGLGDAADIIAQFAAGQTTGADLFQSPDALKNLLGAEISKAGGYGQVQSVEARTKIIQDVLANIDLEKLAEETGGFKAVLEQFSASLFNPRAGLFGALKEFTLGINEGKTTIFKETTELFKSIFGPEGFIKTLGKELAKAFGLGGDDTAFVRFLGRGIRFLTDLIKNVTDLIDDVLNNPIVKGIVEIAKRAFDGIVGLFRRLDEIGKNPPDLSAISTESITSGIRQIGEGIRDFLKKIGDNIRGTDISEGSESGTSILNTIIDEAGKTLIAFFREVGGALLGKVGTITADLATKLPGTILGLFTRLFSEGGPIGIIIGSVIAAKVGRAAFGGAQALGGGIRSVRNIFNRQEGGPLGALNRSLNRPFSPLNQVRTGDDLEGGRGGFQSQVLSRMDAIIRILGGYQGPSSPLELGDTDPRRGPRPPEGSDIDRPRKGERVGRDGRTSRQRAQDLRRQRGGFRGRIGRFGSRVGDFIGDVGYVAREAAGGFLENAGDLIRGNDDYLDDFDRNIDRPVKKGERVGRDGRTSRQRALDMKKARGGRFGGLGRGLRGFGGKLAIAGGILTVGSMIAGNRVEASQTDPITGEPIAQPQMGAGQAFGNIGMQIGQGALAGAAFGPWGAAIGGILGAGVALMDKGTRDAAGKWVSDLMGSIGKFTQNFIGGTGKFISGIVDSLGKAGQSVIKFFVEDLPSIWLRGMKTLYIDIPKSLLNFGVELGKSMLDSVSNFNLGDVLKNTWESIKNFATRNNEPARAAGGNVYAGITYRVGEHGEEEFRPTQNGTIINNATLRGIANSKTENSSRGNTTFNITINATGLAGNDIAAAIRPAVIDVIDAAWTQASGNIVTRGATII